MRKQSDDVNARADGDDDGDDGIYFCAHQNQMPQRNLNDDSCVWQRNLNDDSCVCFSFSDAYYHLSFPMNLTQNAFASFSCVSSLFFSSYHRQKTTRFPDHLLFHYSLKETFSYACS